MLAVADARRFSLLPAPALTLPGLPAGALPPIDGTLTAQLVASVDASRLDGLSGHVRLTGFRAGAVTGDPARIPMESTPPRPLTWMIW